MLVDKNLIFCFKYFIFGRGKNQKQFIAYNNRQKIEVIHIPTGNEK